MKFNGRFWKKFAMKWRFRLDHARAVFGLLTFALLLAVSYVEYVSFLAKLGFGGVIILAVIISLGFAVVGYAYDRIFKLWTEDTTVRVERSPYTYMPHPKEHIISKALNYTIMFLLSKNAETKEEAELFRKMLDYYYSLSPTVEEYKENSDDIKILTNEFIRKLMEKMKQK